MGRSIVNTLQRMLRHKNGFPVFANPFHGYRAGNGSERAVHLFHFFIRSVQRLRVRQLSKHHMRRIFQPQIEFSERLCI